MNMNVLHAKQYYQQKEFFFSHRSANCTMNGKKKIKNPQTCLNFGKVLLSKDVLRLQIQRVHGNEKANGGFQLEFVSISRVINHMTCYKLESFHWWKIYFQ